MSRKSARIHIFRNALNLAAVADSAARFVLCLFRGRIERPGPEKA
jgi:hypothetical protein